MSETKQLQMRIESLRHCIEVCAAAGNEHGRIQKLKLLREAKERLRRLRA